MLSTESPSFLGLREIQTENRPLFKQHIGGWVGESVLYKTLVRQWNMIQDDKLEFEGFSGNKILQTLAHNYERLDLTILESYHGGNYFVIPHNDCKVRKKKWYLKGCTHACIRLTNAAQSLTISRFPVTPPASAPVQHKLSGSIQAGLKLVRMTPNSSPQILKESCCWMLPQ